MNRLQAVREIEGWTQRDLSELLGVSPQLISKVEIGTRPLTFTIRPLGYADERFHLPSMSEPLHRQRAATRTSQAHRAKELLRLAGEVFIELRKAIARVPEVALQRMAAPMRMDEVEDLAQVLRLMLLQEESGPIRNLTSAVERAGVCLAPLAALEGIDGMSAWVDEEQPVIGLSPSVPGDRFRFSLAHELFHLTFPSVTGQIAEDEANRFAGALLIPKEDLAAALPTLPTLRDFIGLKAGWGISVAAIIYRAHELDHINDSRYRSLQIQMSRWRKTEPGEFQPVVGTLLPRMVQEAGGIMKVASDLGMRWQHVRDVVNWSPLRAA